jgi:hypothetical protein
MRDATEQTPQAMAIVNIRKTAQVGGSAKTLERAQRNVFLILQPARYSGKPFLGQPYQIGKISFPELPRSFLVTVLDLLQPDGN